MKQTFPIHFYIMLSLLCLLTGLGCKKVIQVNLNNAAPQIVIEGEVTNLGTCQVQITQSVNFSATNTFPPVTGASVQITDSSTGQVAILSELDSGIYTTTSIQGIPLHIYNLQVLIGSKEYTATSTMPMPVVLDSVTFTQNADFNNKLDINAVMNFQDPPGLGNYYQFIEDVNRRLIPDIFVFEDRLSDGKYIQESLFNDSSYLQVGDTLLVKMYCIDKATYNYFNTLINVAGNNNFQTATPANPITNISNGALGYFSAHTTTQRRLVID
jgi:Domain of unknown function (DUF4249)